MCELLVRTIDKRRIESPADQARVSQRGDVIVICADGWTWSDRERTNPEWTMVKVPGVNAEQLSAFIQSEAGDPAVNLYLRWRKFCFDLDAYGGGELTLAEALNLKFERAAVVDPNVIGHDPRVIG